MSISRTHAVSLWAGFVFSFLVLTARAQDTSRYTLMLHAPVLDVPQNFQLHYVYPSMQQSISLGSDLYDLGYWGIDAVGQTVFKPSAGRIPNHVFNYAAGLIFSRFASSLPIPLGEWTHEEFHRSILGVNDIASKNGNWMLSRWDGTVYGVTDAQMDKLKKTEPSSLLYAYTAGVQSENMYTLKNVTQDFFHKRTFYKGSFYLYNAWYVWNYFRFATSSLSDSVKKIAPEFESKDPSQRDFAGADLTAWAYDMFQPGLSFTARDSFPNGEGVNRRVGFHDLPAEAQQYLEKQKKLSLFNFLNPAIFMVNRIPVSRNFSLMLFTQYAPTHFGNDISLVIPCRYKKYDYMLGVHKQSNHERNFFAIDAGIYNQPALNNHLSLDGSIHYWQQPLNQSFYDTKAKSGGAIELGSAYSLNQKFRCRIQLTGKTAGWLIGNPYLKSNISASFGIDYVLRNE